MSAGHGPWNPCADVRLYQAALRLYPPAFRREFAPQMLLDFVEARGEAAGTGMWTFRAHIGRDLAMSLLTAWFRTGLPAVAVIAAAIPLLVLSAMLRFVDRFPPVSVPDTIDRDLLALELFIVVFLLVVAATIVFVTWHLHRMAARLPGRRRP